MLNENGLVVGPDWIKTPHDQFESVCEALSNARTWPKITIVTPAFQAGEFIRDAIESVRLQRYPNLEYIVVDACSDDGTADILADYDFVDARIKPDGGQASALDKAFRNASGDILTWLNADDMLAPLALFRMALAFEQYDVDLITGQAVIFDETGPLIRHIYGLPDGPLIERELLDLEAMWNSGQYFYQPEVFFTRRIYEAAGGRIDASLHYSMDYDLWVRIAQAGGCIAGIGAPVALFRKHKGQKTADPTKFKAELADYVSSHTVEQRTPPRYARLQFDGQRNPRVLMVNDLGFQYGAGIGHGRYAAAFRMLGCEVGAFALAEEASDGNHQRQPDYERIVADVIRNDVDLVVLGNVHGATHDLTWLPRLANEVEVWIVSHDFYYLTGRCAYFGGCDKYLDARCDHECPTFFEFPALPSNQIAKMARVKRDILAHPNVRVLANSRYSAQQFHAAFAARGLMESEISEKVLIAELGARVEEYRVSSTDKRTIRAELGLPKDKHLVILPSGDYTNQRKNAPLAWRLFAQLDQKLFHAVIVGASNTRALLFAKNVTQFDYTKDRDYLARLFKAADFAVNTSFDETFGQTIVEAALAGAVPISLGHGAAPELVARLGLTVRPVDADDDMAIRSAVAFIGDLADDASRLASEQARVALAASNSFSLDAVARRLHIAMMKSGLLSRRKLKSTINLFGPLDEPPVTVLGEWAPDRLAQLGASVDQKAEEIEHLKDAIFEVTRELDSRRAENLDLSDQLKQYKAQMADLASELEQAKAAHSGWLSSAEAKKDWYKGAFLQILEECRHEDLELEAFHERVSSALYEELIEEVTKDAVSIGALAAHLRQRLSSITESD
ncbi:glycosyltransferase [Hyphobacterium sp.]|uniref:glycosyltransferase n=1 Tax=Hyphobacterium sp. TaxID=2004662 RepID=UPI003748BFC4